MEERTLIQLARYPKGEADSEEIVEYVGYLVDKEGKDVPAPMIGERIYLGGDDDVTAASQKKWIIQTTPVKQITIHQEYWEVETISGEKYVLYNQRTYH